MEAFVKRQVFYSKKVFFERTLPKAGEILVKVGDLVKPFDILGFTYVSPLSRRLSLAAGSRVSISDGEEVSLGQVVALKPGFWFREKVKAPIAGRAEVTGDEIIIFSSPEKFNLTSGIFAKVAKIVEKRSCLLETEASLVRGVWACGLEVAGEIKVFETSNALKVEDLSVTDLGKILVYPGLVPTVILQKARAMGVAAFVCAAIEESKGCPLNVLVTEGFGAAQMSQKLVEMLRTLAVKTGIVSPERKEFIVPGFKLPGLKADEDVAEVVDLKIGQRVQIVAWPHFGAEAEVLKVLGITTFASGVASESALVKLGADGETLTVAASNILVLV